METLHPGIYIVDKGSEPTIEGVGVSTGGIVGTFEKGPADKPGFVTSWEDSIRMYGSYYNDYYAPIAVKRFFDNGGTKLYIARVLGSGASKSEISLKDTPAFFLKSLKDVLKLMLFARFSIKFK